MNTTFSGVMIGAARILNVLMRPFAPSDDGRAERVLRMRSLIDRVLRHAQQARDYGLVVFDENRWLWADDAAELRQVADEIPATDSVTAERLRNAAASVQTWGENAARGVKGCEESRKRATAVSSVISTLQSVGRQPA